LKKMGVKQNSIAQLCKIQFLFFFFPPF